MKWSNKYKMLELQRELKNQQNILKNISDIKTPNLTLEKKLIVVGKGSGHGVGMSQWGAKYMASKGKKAEMILRHFYKGVKIRPFDKNHL